MLTSFADAQLFGESYGTGAPRVLALHGWRRDHRDFDGVLSGTDAFASIALDLPGHGATPPPEVAWGSPEYARALVPLLHEMDPPVVVIAHSFGGRVAVHLAALAPGQIAGLVLTAVPLFRAVEGRRRPPLKFRLAKRLAAAKVISPERLEEERQRYGSADYRAASGVMRDVFVTLVAEDYRDVLDRVSCPVELVWGDNDSEVPVSVAHKVEAALPRGAALQICQGVGHMTPLAVPGELRAAAERLLP